MTGPRYLDRQLGRFSVLAADAHAARAAKQGCDDLLRAHLGAGQHLLTFAAAEALGATLGMRPGTVRAAAGDPTITKQGRRS